MITNEHPTRKGHYRRQVSETDDRMICMNHTHEYVQDAYACAFDAMWNAIAAETEDPTVTVADIETRERAEGTMGLRVCDAIYERFHTLWFQDRDTRKAWMDRVTATHDLHVMGYVYR